MSDTSDYIPYATQAIDESDEQAVLEALRSALLTTGPLVAAFEQQFCAYVKAPFGVAVSSCTAALHTAVHAAGVGKGDEVIVSPLTFAASANCVLYAQGTPVFADVDPHTLLISPDAVARQMTPRTKAVIAVDYAGQPCDYPALRAVCDRHGVILIADCAHSPGAAFQGKTSAEWADIATYSFHPVKHLTSGEGGMVVTHRREWAADMRRFRNHGIDTDHTQRLQQGTWEYNMVSLGYNYRLSDIQCALASSQLRKLDQWIHRRCNIAAQYDKAFTRETQLAPLSVHKDARHVWHLYVIQLAARYGATERQQLFEYLRNHRIGVNVHYIPVYRHAYYVEHQGGAAVSCPFAESAYERIISLPMYSALTDEQVSRVISCVKNGLHHLGQ